MTPPEKMLDLRLQLCKTQIDNGEPAKALGTLRQLKVSHPDNDEVLTYLGFAHLALANPTGAIEHFRGVYSRRKGAGAALNLSAALFAAGNYKESRDILNQALDQHEYLYQERLLHNIGLSYKKEGLLGKAEHYFRQAIAKNPAYYLSHLQLYYLYSSQSKLDKAIGHLRVASNVCPVCYEASDLLAEYYRAHGKKDQAAVVLRRFLKQTEAHPDHLRKARQALVRSTEERS